MKNDSITKPFAGQKVSKLMISVLLAFTLCCIPFAAGCNSQQQKSQKEQILDKTYPNTLAENAKVSDQYKEISDKITQDNINYFLEICKIPHPSGNLSQIEDYIKKEYTKLGFSPQVDPPSNSIYVDIPASANSVNKPKVIIQAHMDMVPTVGDPNSGIDLNKQGVDVQYDKETGQIKSVGGKTNIGADDGVGMSLMLAMAKNANSYDHPAMRFLYTEDEEVGLVGASKISPSVLDADYLINYDGSRVGEVVVSCAGSFDGNFSKNYTVQAPTATDQMVNIKVTDLVGGHSADAAPLPRIHASNLALDCMKKLSENNIEYKISYIKTGKVSNALPTTLTMQFYVDSSKKDQAKSICEDYIKESIKNATDEVNAKYEVIVGNSSSLAAQNPISAQDSATLVNSLSKVPKGAIKMSEVNKSLPETSCAMCILTLENGQLTATGKLRSSDNPTIDKYKQEFKNIATEGNLGYSETAAYYGCPDGSNTNLTQAMLEGYKQAAGIEAVTNICHGGLEMSHFQTVKPGLKMINIGSDIKDEHMTSETYYTKSQSANTAAVLYTINHL